MKKKLFTLTTTLLIISMFACGSVFATTENVITDKTPATIEVSQTRAMETFTDSGVAYPGNWPGQEFTTSGTKLTVHTKAWGSNSNVTVALYKKGLFGFQKVNGTNVTIPSDNQAHNILSAFPIQSGATYKLYYETSQSTNIFSSIIGY